MLTKQKPLTLSVIIPVFNEQAYLKQCLDSLANQSIKPSEVIVVDNNSTDRSADLVKRYPFVKLINESQQGIVYARDTGFNYAKSDLLGRIDADVVLPETWVEDVLKIYGKNADFALSGSSTYRNIPVFGASKILIDFFYFGFSRLFLGHHTLFGSNMVLPRKTWLEIQNSICSDDYYHEDTDLSLHVANSIKIIKSNKIKSTAAFRMRDKPGGVHTYVIRWFDTIKHGWQINKLSKYSYFLQLKNSIYPTKD